MDTIYRIYKKTHIAKFVSDQISLVPVDSRKKVDPITYKSL